LRTGIQELALTRDVQAHFLGDSPITKRLADVRALFLGGTYSLTPEQDRVRAANIRVEPLIQAEKAYFAETDYNTDDQQNYRPMRSKVVMCPSQSERQSKKGAVQISGSR